MVTYAKISSKMVKPRDIAGSTQGETEVEGKGSRKGNPMFRSPKSGTIHAQPDQHCYCYIRQSDENYVETDDSRMEHVWSFRVL